MRIATIRKDRPERTADAEGVARLDRRTKDLTKRLRPGDIAVIDHVDLDRVSADALVACKVSAVVNASPSISGRYPNLGPGIIVDSGIPLLDNVGKQIFSDSKRAPGSASRRPVARRRRVVTQDSGTTTSRSPRR